ncbi:signal recognition particle subunit SRP68-like [Pan troglodytes]|uniref:signal recognition particle subunit SRP68-like n=1 Tax=Pan troglodytes TaxID=9598 RepID=UPI0030133B0D
MTARPHPSPGRYLFFLSLLSTPVSPGAQQDIPRFPICERRTAKPEMPSQAITATPSQTTTAKPSSHRKASRDLPDMQELITQVWSEKCSLQAAAILDANDAHQTETSSSQVKDNKPLVERFETFCLDPSLVTKQANLVHFPPGFQPIPCKPLFFDLALNHVAFPPLEDKLEQKTKSGLTGYIKGIFGFRS